MRNRKCHPITSPPLQLNLLPTHKSRSPPTMPITGACLCGKTTVSLESAHEDQVSPVDRLSSESVNRPFLEQIICHCNDCKRTSGSAFSTNVLAPSKDVTIKGPTKEFGIKADSGNIGGFSAQVVTCMSSHLESPQSPGSSAVNVDVPSRTCPPSLEIPKRSRLGSFHSSLGSRFLLKVSSACNLANLVSHSMSA